MQILDPTRQLEQLGAVLIGLLLLDLKTGLIYGNAKESSDVRKPYVPLPLGFTYILNIPYINAKKTSTLL